MELQAFINDNSDYLEKMKEYGFCVKNYNKLGLSLVKNDYNKEIICDENESWKLDCKSVLINSKTHQIVSLSPQKSQKIDSEHFQDALNYEKITESTEIQQLIDGTMINVVHHNDEWIIQSRSEIGGHNRNYQCPQFKKLFDECCMNRSYDELQMNHCYSFVMRHTKNRIVTPVHKDMVVLVDVFEKETNRRLPNQEIVSLYGEYDWFETITNVSLSELTDIQGLPWHCKGYTFRTDGRRYTWINPKYKYVLDLTMNQMNPCFHYIQLRQNGQCSEYLKYYPEKKHQYMNFRDKIHKMTNELYSIYKNIRIHKTLPIESCPFQLKPLLFKLHKIYLDTKKPISWKDMTEFVHKLDPKQLTFVLNYY